MGTHQTDKMKLLLTLMVLFAFTDCGICCVIKTWNVSDSPSWEWSCHQCDDSSEIATFYATDGMECCPMPGSLKDSSVVTLYDFYKCPEGYFVQGLMDKKNEFGYKDFYRCVKPVGYQPVYKSCYDEPDVRKKCRSDYFYVGDVDGATMRCCQPFDDSLVVDSKDKLKDRIMEDIIPDLAKLADMLGFSYTQGCIANAGGESFDRSGYNWYANTGYDCVDQYHEAERLKIKFADWGFQRSSFVYGEPEVGDLPPEVVDSGTIVNNDATEATHELKHEETVLQSVSHTATSAWKQSQQVGVSIGVSSSITAEAGIPGIGSVSATVGVTFESSYSFNYESSESTTYEEGGQQSKTLTVTNSKAVAPYSTTRYTIALIKGSMKVPYTVTYIMSFSTVFEGFLRSDSVYKGQKGFVTKQFGDAEKPFYQYLKSSPRNPSSLWEWNKIYSEDNQKLIDKLSDENRYEVKLTGIFTVVAGRKLQVYWDGEEADQGTTKLESSSSVRVSNLNSSAMSVTPMKMIFAVMFSMLICIDIFTHELF